MVMNPTASGQQPLIHWELIFFLENILNGSIKFPVASKHTITVTKEHLSTKK